MNGFFYFILIKEKRCQTIYILTNFKLIPFLAETNLHTAVRILYS
jgi:hypothetical protein